MNKEIDALVAKQLDEIASVAVEELGFGVRSDFDTIKRALMAARALGLEEAAEACEKLAMSGNEKSIYVGAFEYAIAVRALKGE